MPTPKLQLPEFVAQVPLGTIIRETWPKNYRYAAGPSALNPEPNPKPKPLKPKGARKGILMIPYRNTKDHVLPAHDKPHSFDIHGLVGFIV